PPLKSLHRSPLSDAPLHSPSIPTRRSSDLGLYENVLLSQSELDGLKADLPDKWNYYIDRLYCHIASSGKRYRSHAATIYKWAQRSEEHTSELQSRFDIVCRLLLDLTTTL